MPVDKSPNQCQCLMNYYQSDVRNVFVASPFNLPLVVGTVVMLSEQGLTGLVFGMLRTPYLQFVSA